VATKGNDSVSCSAATNINSPKRTVANVISSGCLSPGDTVLIRGGTYAGETWNSVSGTQGNPITFKAYPGETPKYDGHLGTAGGANYRVVEMCCDFVHDVVIDGLEFTSSDPWIDQARQLDVQNPLDLQTFKNTYLPDPRINLSGFEFNTPNPPGNNARITFQNNYVHHLIAGGASVCGDQIRYLNNRIMDLVGPHGGPRSSYGCYCTFTNSTFRGNVFDRNTYGLHLYDGSGQTWTEKTVFEQNIFSHNGLGYWYHMSSGNMKLGADGLLVANDRGGNAIMNNLFYGNGGNGLALWNPAGDLVVNNTFYRNGFVNSESFGLSVGVNRHATPADVIRNNIFYSNRGDLSINGSPTADHNLTTNPRFVNASNADFHLTANSHARDAGLSLPQVPCDFDGNGRPAGSAYDIGAYEYGASPSSNCPKREGTTTAPSPTPRRAHRPGRRSRGAEPRAGP
jgi:hypothetical protein